MFSMLIRIAIVWLATTAVAAVAFSALVHADDSARE